MLTSIHPNSTKPPNAGAPDVPDPDELKRRVDLLAFIGADTYLKKVASTRGGEYAGRCPFCGGKDRFRVQPNNNPPRFFCRQCEASGSVIDYVMKRDNLSFPEALVRLGQGSATLHSTARPAAPETAHSEPPPAAWQQEARRRIDAAQRYLWSDAPDARAALDYLHGRGLSNDTIRAAGLGFNPDWTRSSYRNPDTGKLAKLPPGIIIPYENDGVVWAIRVRTDPRWNGLGLDKYLSFAGSKLAGTLYGGDALQPGRDVLFVEGEFDCLLAQQLLGERVAVVTLGSASSHLARRWQERMAGAGQVYALLDSDNAGQQATARLVEQLPDAIPLHLPTGKDVTEFVQQGGDLRGWFELATAPPSEPIAATVGMEQVLNEFGAIGEALIWRAVCALREHGIIPTTNEPHIITREQIDEGLRLIGSFIGKKTLERYLAAPEKTILHPIDDANIGCTFVLNPEETVKAALDHRIQVALRVRIFRGRAKTVDDPATGKPYTLQPVIADLEQQAFEDAGLPPTDAASSAELLKEQSFDKPIRREREKASKRFSAAYAKYRALLSSTAVIPLLEGMPIDSEGDLKRAQLRAWHMAGLEGFQTDSEQMHALGIGSKHTLFKMQADAGITRDPNIIPIEIRAGDDIGQKVWEARRGGAWPTTYKTLDTDTGEWERKLYNRAAMETDRQKGVVILECRAANNHYVTELPTPEEKPKRERQPAESSERQHKPTVRQQTPRGHYPRQWVIDQLRLRYQAKFRREAPYGATVRQLTAALIPDPLLATAFELGAVVRKL